MATKQIRDGFAFERRFFGRPFFSDHTVGITANSLSFEVAVENAREINHRDYSWHKKPCPADELLALVKKELPHRGIKLRCAVQTVLDRDFGVDGYFSVRNRYNNGRSLATFDLTCNDSVEKFTALKADIRIMEPDLSREMIRGLAVAIANVLRKEVARDAEGRMIDNK